MKSEETSSSKKRLFYIDVIRVLAIISVIIMHASENLLRISTSTWNVANETEKIANVVLTGFGRLGVPLFLMITGFLMINRTYTVDAVKRFYLRNYLPLVVSFEIWNLLAYIALRRLQNISLRTYLMSSLLIGHQIVPAFWYMRFILIIYPFIPLMSYIIKHVSERVFTVVLISGIMICCVAPSVILCFRVLQSDGLPRYAKILTYGMYPLYLLIGTYLHEKQIMLSPALLLSVTAISVSATSLLTYALFDSGIDPGMGYWTLSTLVASCSLFILVYGDSRQGSRVFFKIVTLISMSAYGIYLIHQPIMTILTTVYPLSDFYMYRFIMVFICTPILSFTLIRLLSIFPWCRKWMLQMH